MDSRRKYGDYSYPIPRRGQIKSRIFGNIPDYITGVTKIVEEPLLGRIGRGRSLTYEGFTNEIDESEPLHSSGDQIEVKIKNEVIGWYTELKVVEEIKGKDENFIKLVEEMRQLALYAEDIALAFNDYRERQHERGRFMKFVFFFNDMMVRHNFRKQIMNIRVNRDKLISEGKEYDDVEIPPQPIPRLQLSEPSSSEGEIKQYQASLIEAANALPSYMKLCLFCFGLFQEDYDIPARRLIVLWVAEGLVRPENNRQEPPEFLAEKVLQKFEEENMIQEVKKKPNKKIKTCRMNADLRYLWMPRAGKANFFHTCSKTTNSNSSSEVIMIHRLADHFSNTDRNISFSHIHGNGKADSSDIWSYYKNLTTFLSFDSREGDAPGEDIGNFLRKGISRRCFQRLRVLDLERAFRPKLPDSIGKLICLRYLGLRWTYLEKLPSSIDNLLTLQTLDLKHTYISTLQISWWKMKQLRHLYLSESYRSRFVVRRGRNNLTDLQTLWGAFLDDESSVYGLHNLTNLRKLGLVIQLREFEQDLLCQKIMRIKGLESLRLIAINESVKPSCIYFKSLLDLTKLSSLYLLGSLNDSFLLEMLPQNLTDLTLSLSQLDYDPMPKLGKLQNLTMLRLSGNAYTKNVMTCYRGDFPELKVLKLWKQEILDEWVVKKGSLVVLQELEIRSCKNLKMIPDGFKHLKTLRELKLTNMPKEFTASLNERQGEDWEKFKMCHVLNES